MDKFDIEKILSRDEYSKVLNYISNDSKNKTKTNNSIKKLQNVSINIDQDIIDFNKKWPFTNKNIDIPSEYMIATQSAKYSLSHTINLDSMIDIFKNKINNDT